MGLGAATDILIGGPGSVVGVYEPTYRLVETVAIPAITYWLNLLIGEDNYKINLTKYNIETKDPNIGNIQFGSYSHPDQIVGYQTFSSHLDELDTVSVRETVERAWDQIQARNRQQPSKASKECWVKNKIGRKEVFNRIYAYSTPEGFNMCYKLWGDKNNKLPGFHMVQGRSDENPSMAESWLEGLKIKYTPLQLQAYLYGEFVNFNAATVYGSYNPKVHYSNETVQSTDILYIGIDFNVNHTCGNVFVQRNDGWHAVDEFYDALDTYDLVKKIRSKYANFQVVACPDSTGHYKTGNSRQTHIQILRSAGFSIKAFKRNPLVEDRVNTVNAAFNRNKLFINKQACSNMNRCLIQQAYDKNGDPDKKSGTDHSNDATGYFCMQMLPFKVPFMKMPYSFPV